MEQQSLWDGIEVDTSVPAKPRCEQILSTQERQHHHMKLWFYDARRHEVIICSEQPPDQRYNPDEVWSTQFVGGSLTAAGCVICNPPEEEDEVLPGEEYNEEE